MKKIVLIEDDESIRDSLLIILKRAGYEVSEYQNGNSLLNGDFERADLYLIDKQLSGVDGLDICKYIKSYEDMRDVPIIIISASPELEKYVKAAGADNFIEKPFSKKRLLELIEKYLSALGFFYLAARLSVV